MNEKPPPQRPEDIPIRYGAIEPTDPERAAIKELRRQLFRYGRRGNDRGYDSLDVLPRETPLSAAFGVNRTKALPDVVFQANIHTTLGYLGNGRKGSLEWVILHENGHLHYGTFCIRRNLESISHTMAYLRTLQRNMEAHPHTARKCICAQFGSLGAFKQSLLEWNREMTGTIEPTLNELNEMPLFILPVGFGRRHIPSAEQLASYMERSDPAHLQLKQTLERIPYENIDRRWAFLNHLHATLGDMSNIMNTQSDIPDGRDAEISELAVIIRRSEFNLGNLNMLRRNLAQAEEYAADRYALQHAGNPDSGEQFLRWNAEFRAREESKPFHEVFYEDYGENNDHPSPAKRIMRMRFIREHHRPPDDDEFHQLLENDTRQNRRDWQASIRVAGVPPGQLQP